MVSQTAGEEENAEARGGYRGQEIKAENGHNKTHAVKQTCWCGCEDTVGTQATLQ